MVDEGTRLLLCEGGRVRGACDLCSTYLYVIIRQALSTYLHGSTYPASSSSWLGRRIGSAVTPGACLVCMQLHLEALRCFVSGVLVCTHGTTDELAGENTPLRTFQTLIRRFCGISRGVVWCLGCGGRYRDRCVCSRSLLCSGFPLSCLMALE